MFTSLVPKTRLKPLHADCQPNGIYYAPAPPSSGIPSKKIPISEFLKIYRSHGGDDFNWTETIWFDEDIIRSKGFVDRNQLHEEMRADFESYLTDPSRLTDRLEIRFINDDVGFGVFAREAIGPYEIVAMYAGEHDLFGCSTDYSLGTYGRMVGSIDAKEMGGIARFIQHMPTSMHTRYYHAYLTKDGRGRSAWSSQSTFSLRNTCDLEPPIAPEDYERTYQSDNPHLPVLPLAAFDSNIASSNVLDDFYLMDGVPLYFLHSIAPILPGDPIGLNYGSGYWANRVQVPVLFNTNGDVSSVQDDFTKWSHLGSAQYESGDTKESYRSYQEALSLLDQQCFLAGIRLKMFVQLQVVLGTCMQEMHQYPNALVHYDAAKEVCETDEELQSEYYQIHRISCLCRIKIDADNANDQAVSLYKSSKFEGALDLFKTVLSQNQFYFQNTLSLDVASAHWNLSSCLMKLEYFIDALEHALDCYEIRCQLLGSDHVKTQSAYLRWAALIPKTVKGSSLFDHGRFGFNCKTRDESDSSDQRPCQ